MHPSLDGALVYPSTGNVVSFTTNPWLKHWIWRTPKRDEHIAKALYTEHVVKALNTE